MTSRREPKRERPGMTWALRFLCWPSAKCALTHHQQAGGGMACGHRAPSGGGSAGGPSLPVYTSRRQRWLVHRAELRRCTGGLGAVATNKLRRVYTGALLAATVSAYKRGLKAACDGGILCSCQFGRL